MFNKIKKLKIKEILSRENYGVIAITLFGLWVGWNSLFVITKNNRLINEIQTKAEETAVLELENENLALNIEYFRTDEFIEKSARENLLLKAPGENVAIAPKTENAVFNPPSINEKPPEIEKTNLQKWLDFFMGRKD